jgi:transcriptional regulator of acetoin/glycerol metabolism
VTPELLSALVAYDWPDNVRELDCLIRRLLVDADGGRLLGVELLVDDLACYGMPARRRAPFGERLQDIERAIERAAGNKAEAARLLGIGRATLNRHVAASRGVRCLADETPCVKPSETTNPQCLTDRRETPEVSQ